MVGAGGEMPAPIGCGPNVWFTEPYNRLSTILKASLRLKPGAAFLRL